MSDDKRASSKLESGKRPLGGVVSAGRVFSARRKTYRKYVRQPKPAVMSVLTAVKERVSVYENVREARLAHIKRCLQRAMSPGLDSGRVLEPACWRTEGVE